ncbi:unnamed protein product [Nippostrongylus brasiliensis]|uniref:C2 domain-containing protein n=1 Tax=Nippostrongylus brasiliensis TaxID=27835 RepID=A0A0N4Y466_NIPBR|nr:unnamed protein product [Nippostrongylus brasiliensis]
MANAIIHNFIITLDKKYDWVSNFRVRRKYEDPFPLFESTTPGTGGAGQGGPARPGGGSADGGAGGGGDYPPRKRNARSDSNETPDPGYGSRTSKNSSTHKSKKKKQKVVRTLFVEGVKINLIALAMKFCLDVEQPDRSGKYGSSVAVHYRSSQGDTMMSKEVGLVDNFVHEVAVDPLSESRGPFSELVPADMVTILALIEDSTEEERMLAMSLLKMEHDDKMIALTINGVDPNEIGFLIKVYVGQDNLNRTLKTRHALGSPSQS